jgi:hypothetical protein
MPLPADIESVESESTPPILVRLAAIVLGGIVATTGVTFAASQGVPATGTTPTVTTVAPPTPLTVPDVRKLAFVFAKSELEDGGFAWKVTGSVHGYPANTVVSQKPAPGTLVVDSGAPTVTLTLERAKGYPESGVPADTSPYAGSRVEFAAAAGQ